MSDKITLDRETFKVLAADTRVDMLKRIAEHKLTLTDLANQMDMSPSTIKEHLDKLVDAGLIEADERGMKWKYYRLTNKGRNIVSPQETTVWILLGTTILVIAGSVLSLAGKMGDYMTPSFAKSAAPPNAGALIQKVVEETTTLAQPAPTLLTAPSQVGALMQKASEETTTLAQPASKQLADHAINSGGAAANETVRMLAEYRAADKEVSKGLMSVAGAVQNAVNQTVETTTSTLRELTTSTTLPAPPIEHAAAVTQFPFLEVTLIFLSLVVAGACTGYILRTRLQR
jgi:DNA-binding transcriptional ArsR family regulator